ncbi:hypothetical protein CHARACLAT_011985 [Characodon lateralis]|uniref:Uncharacterized protein n=1 Tax=Characodon lateralis TaxID=208331 RepID=A0ABU7F2R2_9TELE|nr:hypothetical protein [Characodon lateralis]
MHLIQTFCLENFFFHGLEVNLEALGSPNVCCTLTEMKLKFAGASGGLADVIIWDMRLLPRPASHLSGTKTLVSGFKQVPGSFRKTTRCTFNLCGEHTVSFNCLVVLTVSKSKTRTCCR